MPTADSRVTIHMAASLDGFVARSDGSIDWMEVVDDFPNGEDLDPQYIAEFLEAIDCYVMGSKTYETALDFQAKGLGWAYGDKPVFVLTTRGLPRSRETVDFLSGDLTHLFREKLRPRYRNIWVVGGGHLCGECLRLGLADEVRYSVLPVVIGEGIRFFAGLDTVVALHLLEVKACKSGIVALRHEVRK